MTNIVPMPGRVLTSDQRSKIPNEDIVNFLRKVLSQAIEGDLQAVAFAGVYSDQASWDQHIAPTTWDSIHLLGAVTLMQQRLSHNINVTG